MRGLLTTLIYEITPMNRSHRANQPFFPIRHLMDDEIEKVCLSQTGGGPEDWQEDLLVVCPECLGKAERVLEQMRELKMPLRSDSEPALRYLAPFSGSDNVSQPYFLM